jgi:CRISPR type I-E-associated protein CasB/Cse2
MPGNSDVNIDFKKRAAAFLHELRRLRHATEREGASAPDAKRDLAILRGDLRDMSADRYRATRIVAPHLNERERDDDELFFLVGGLFALYPDEISKRSLGGALGSLADQSGGAEARLMALLPSRVEDLRKPLRSIVSLMSSKGKRGEGSVVALDYERLLIDLSQWNWDGRPVQNSWARDFYQTASKNNTADVPSEIETSKENTTNE